jgi:hypothetical protein
MMYSVVVYRFDGNTMTVIATIDRITDLNVAIQLEDLYQGKTINAYIDGYCQAEWIA